jgi:SSS family transporter
VLPSPLLAALQPLDLGIVIVYILGTTALGAWFSRSQKDTKTYFVGDRNVAWWLVLISIVATETSTVTFLSVPGLAFDREKGNMTFLQLAFGYVLGRSLIAWWLLPQYVKGQWFTAYQLLRQRFDVTVQRVASAIFLCTRTVADGLRLYLTALLLEQFTGWEMTSAILALGGVTLVYTYLGGMQAVIWTDLIQFVIYLTGAGVAAFLILQQMPGGWEGYVAAGASANKFQVIDPSFDLAKNYTLWAGLIGGAFLTMASHGADQTMVQRYLCSRSLTEARLALVSSGVIIVLQFTLFLLIGVGLYGLWSYGLLAAPAKNDQAFGQFILGSMPVGLTGVVVAAVLASAMSSLSSSLNASANAAVTDFYRPLLPGRSEPHYLWVSRWMTVVVGAGKIAVALLAVTLGIRSVVDSALSVAGFTTGVLLGLFALGSLPRPVSSRAAVVGMVVGFLVVLTVWGAPQLADQLAAISPSLVLPAIAWPWFAPIGTLTTVAVGLLVDRFPLGQS